MASYTKQGFARLLGAILVLLMGVGTYEVWYLIALRDHPWQLESYVNVLAADCRAGKGSAAFAGDLRALTEQVNEAKSCLNAADESWAIRRDYTFCVQKLLGAALTALRIRASEAARLQEEKVRLNASVKTLESELDNDALAKQNRAKFEVRNYAQARARTMLAAAHNLAALGQTESALTAALGAWAAWTQSEDFVTAELARFYDSESRARWEKEAQDLLRWTRQSGHSAILVDKLEHRCLLLADGRVAKSYIANLGRNWYQKKVQEYDASTPEGEYRIKQKIRASSFGAALLLDYPNAADRQHFNSMIKAGEISARARIGGDIEIHGGGRLNSDWTDGCVSLENTDMADLFRQAYVGMPVTIVGTSTVGNKQ